MGFLYQIVNAITFWYSNGNFSVTIIYLFILGLFIERAKPFIMAPNLHANTLAKMPSEGAQWICTLDKTMEEAAVLLYPYHLEHDHLSQSLSV